VVGVFFSNPQVDSKLNTYIALVVPLCLAIKATMDATIDNDFRRFMMKGITVSFLVIMWFFGKRARKVSERKSDESGRKLRVATGA
jgi:hypothetical protein